MTDDFTADQLDAARRLFAGPCDFVCGVAALPQLPDSSLPEVAFAGRSNVGKSSLLNALTGRKALARTSHTPGRTQQLNFFNLGGALMLVDLPGYGYAKVSKSQKKQWNKLIRDYLRGRPTLRCVFILVDSRHGLKDSDREIMTMLDEAAVSYRIIMTKTDKTKQAERESATAAIETALARHGAAVPGVALTSAHKDHGINELQAVIAAYAAQG